jgi:hypothetical protein
MILLPWDDGVILVFVFVLLLLWLMCLGAAGTGAGTSWLGAGLGLSVYAGFWLVLTGDVIRFLWCVVVRCWYQWYGPSVAAGTGSVYTGCCLCGYLTCFDCTTLVL